MAREATLKKTKIAMLVNLSTGEHNSHNSVLRDAF